MIHDFSTFVAINHVRSIHVRSINEIPPSYIYDWFSHLNEVRNYFDFISLLRVNNCRVIMAMKLLTLTFCFLRFSVVGSILTIQCETATITLYVLEFCP